MPGVGFSPRRHLRSSRRVASSRAARSPPRVHSGCFSKASSATGAKLSSTAVTTRAQQGGRRRVGQGRAGRIVDVDVPASQLGGDAARQLAVGRDQGRGAAFVLQRLAQRQGDDQRFLMGGRAIGARHMLERRCRRSRPGLGGLRRPHQFGDQQVPRRSAAARPVGDVVAFTTERRQEFAQAELRVRLVELFPARLVHVAVEAGQHDRALRQLGDGGQQVARGGLRAGRAGGDHRRGGRVFAPARRLGADRLGAPFDGVDLAALGQHLGPGLADDGEEGERALPMAGEVALDEAFELAERHALDGQLVEQPAELARELERLRRRLGDGMALVVLEGRHELRQQRLALGGLDGGRQGKRAAVARRHLPLAFVEVAQRRHPRQQGGLAVRRAQEGLAQRPHRAPRRQQDQHVGQRQRIAAMAGEHARRQFVGEAAVDADGEHALHPSTRSAAARASGVPTWNQSPSWNTPNSRPTASARFQS